MSDYVRNVVVRMPLPNEVLKKFESDFNESYNELSERLEKILGYDVSYQTPGTIHLVICYNDEKRDSIPYLDYIIEHYYGEDSGDYGFVLLMHDSEKELYSNIFKTLFKQLQWEFDIQKMVKLTFCYYNGADLPDYYPEEIKINNDIITRKFEFVTNMKENSFLKLPERSTANSAGYDFYVPEDTVCKSHEITMVKSGVKAYFPDDETLLLFNRSSNPKKKGLIILNGVGVVDADYYNNQDNEGEIAGLFYNMTDKDVILKAGEKMMQGIFVKYGITNDDKASGERVGGFRKY